MTDNKYFVFYSDRGYEEHEVFETLVEAKKLVKKVKVFGYPILIYGKEIKGGENE